MPRNRPNSTLYKEAIAELTHASAIVENVDGSGLDLEMEEDLYKVVYILDHLVERLRKLQQEDEYED